MQQNIHAYRYVRYIQCTYIYVIHIHTHMYRTQQHYYSLFIGASSAAKVLDSWKFHHLFKAARIKLTFRAGQRWCVSWRMMTVNKTYSIALSQSARSGIHYKTFLLPIVKCIVLMQLRGIVKTGIFSVSKEIL